MVCAYNRDYRIGQGHSHRHTPTVRPCQTSSNGPGPAGRPRRNVSPADVSFRPGISVSGLGSRQIEMAALPRATPRSSAQQSGPTQRKPTHVRVFGDFSANPPPSPYVTTSTVCYCVLLCRPTTIGGSRHGELGSRGFLKSTFNPQFLNR